MRKLDRTPVAAPPCLSQYNHRTHTWDDVSGADKQQIRSHLQQMQGRRCAYCEGALDVLGQHIEHFRRKHLFPKLTFEWSNLYWSCDQSDSCGHYKDHKAGKYNINDIIEPCIDDPSLFFRFRSDGTIDLRPDLSEADKWRAQETLRVFNLQPHFGRLRNMRKAAASGYIGLLDEIAALPLEDQKEFVRLELESSADEAFFTVILHLFEDVQ